MFLTLAGWSIARKKKRERNRGNKRGWVPIMTWLLFRRGGKKFEGGGERKDGGGRSRLLRPALWGRGGGEERERSCDVDRE